MGDRYRNMGIWVCRMGIQEYGCSTGIYSGIGSYSNMGIGAPAAVYTIGNPMKKFFKIFKL